MAVDEFTFHGVPRDGSAGLAEVACGGFLRVRGEEGGNIDEDGVARVADFAAEARDNGPSVHDGGWAEAAPESGEGAAILLHAEMTKGADEAGGAFPRCEGAHAAEFLALVFLAGLEGLAEAKR